MQKNNRPLKERIKNPQRRKRAMIIFWSIVGFPFGLIFLMLGLISLGAFGDLPTFEELENPRSNLATEVISEDGANLGNFFVENRSFVEYDELSPYLVQALVATEDARFYNHSGIDFIGLARVGFKTVLLAQGQGGGSTISQQLAKNLYPRDTVSSSGVVKAGKLVVAKLKEWITATMLEYNYTKEEIISMYLNTVEYGSNAYGIKSASRTFFDKEPKDLTVEEAAMLVGVVNAPTRYSPRINPERALKRRNTVIDRMGTAGFLADEQVQEASALPITLNYKPISHNEGTATYFREMLRLYMTAQEPKEKETYQSDWDFEQEKKLWANDPLYGWCNKNVKADGKAYNIYKDGLKIYTTINSKMQKYAEQALLEQMTNDIQPRFDRQRKSSGGKIFYGTTKEQDAQIVKRGILSSDRAREMKRAGSTEEQIIAEFNKPIKMRVFTYKGDRDTVLTPKDSMMHYKSFLRAGFMAMEPSSGYVKAYVGGSNFRNFKFDMVRQGRRQVGSTIKPFVYTFAIDHLGYNPCTMVPNLPVSIDLGNGQDPWQPKEAGNREYDGVMHQLRWGLANSRNNYSAWIMKQSSPQAVANFINKMGVTSWIDPVYSLCLGTAEISIFDMVGAFGTFANRGVHTTPFFVTRIEDKQGNVLASFSPTTSDAISESTAYTMLGMLQNNISAGTGGRLRYQYNMTGEVGGKTGTTNNNADAWFMAVTPALVAGSWVGGEERSTHLVNQGEGSVAALPIFGRFMEKVYADKSLGITREDKFLEPIGVVKYNCDEGLTEQSKEAEREENYFE